MAKENTETHRKNFSKSVLCSAGFSSVKICAILWLIKFPGYTPDRESAIFYFKAALNNAKSFYTIICTFL